MIIELKNEIQRAEMEFRRLQRDYDRFVERHYNRRYEPWFEEVSDKYQRRIKRQYFYLLKQEKLLREWIKDDGM